MTLSNESKMKKYLLVAILFATIQTMQGQTFIPTKFTQASHVSFPKAGQRYLFSANLCPATVNLYDGLTATAYFNLPWNLKWRPDLGIIHGRVSNTTDFKTIACTNTNASNLASPSCSFVYRKEMGPIILVEVLIGQGDGYFTSFTTGVEFTSKKIEKEKFVLNEIFDRNSSFVTENATSLVASVSTQYGNISSFNEAFFNFCIAEVSGLGQYATTFTVSGAHPDSAFTTTVCWDIRCNVDTFQNYEVGSDTSYSSLNHVVVDPARFRESGVGVVIIAAVGGNSLSEFELNIRQTKVE